MRKLSVVEFVTLDGVMQGLGGPDEDREGGFEHGGWSGPYGDEVAQQAGDDSARPRPTSLGARPTSTWPRTGPTNPPIIPLRQASTPRRST